MQRFDDGDLNYVVRRQGLHEATAGKIGKRSVASGDYLVLEAGRVVRVGGLYTREGVTEALRIQRPDWSRESTPWAASPTDELGEVYRVVKSPRVSMAFDFWPTFMRALHSDAQGDTERRSGQVVLVSESRARAETWQRCMRVDSDRVQGRSLFRIVSDPHQTRGLPRGSVVLVERDMWEACKGESSAIPSVRRTLQELSRDGAAIAVVPCTDDLSTMGRT